MALWKVFPIPIEAKVILCLIYTEELNTEETKGKQTQSQIFKTLWAPR